MPFKDFSGSDSNRSNSNTGGNTAPAMPNIQMPGGQTDIESMLINYNDEFVNADATLFRDSIITQTLSVLIGHNKPNALLVGSAGVGKTRIVEEIARRIATGDPTIPDQLAKSTIYELPLANIVAGSAFVGVLEEKTQALIEFFEDPDNDAICFIDEIHTLMGRSEAYSKIAQIFKPALARGKIRTIGATTLQEAQDLMNDPAFNRRFSRIIVDELSRAQTAAILSKSWASLATHYLGQISISSEDTFDVIAAVADQYATASQHRPDGAITLLDRVCADAIVDRKAKVAELDQATASVILSSPIKLTERRIRNCAKLLATGQSQMTALDNDSLSDALSEIYGQDEAIATITKLVRLSELELFPRTQPITIMCAGPSGTGKSAIARIIANQLTGMPPITLNMTEYNSSASINRIIGSPAGYVGSDSHAELPFDVLESNPYQVILLDEMEKCDRSVQRLFMGAFDDGYIKTARGKVVDFSKTIIFVTTNASHTTGASHACGFNNTTTINKTSEVTDSLSNWFDIEFLNRFKTIITFNSIDKDIYRNILIDKYNRHYTRIKRDHTRINLPDTIDDDDLDNLVETTYVPTFGARPAERAIQTYIEDLALSQS